MSLINNQKEKNSEFLTKDAFVNNLPSAEVSTTDALEHIAPPKLPKLTKEQKAQRKKRLLEKRKDYRMTITNMQHQLTELVNRRDNYYNTLPDIESKKINDQLILLKESLRLGIANKTEVEQKISELNNALSNMRSHIKHLPEVYELRTKIKSLKKDISQYKILLKDKDPDLEVFRKSFKDTNIFEVQNLNLWYQNGNKLALRDINIEIKKNKVTALIGPSGCGKSTFLRSLNRMNDLIDGVKTTGDIWFLGKNIVSKILTDLELRTRVGMVFQKPTPFNFSIYENIAYPLKSHGIKDKKIINEIVVESLKGAALWDEVKNILHESALSLSGGQQQRLCIARAIALQPDVLLMDEPTSALDPIATSKVEQLIHHLKEKFSIVIVTHSMAQAQRISDETVFFYQGRIIESDETKKIFTQPKEKRTKDYVSGRIG